MNEATIEVQRREGTGKGVSRRLRGAGIVPAVLYGASREALAIQVPRKTLLDLFKSGGHENRIFLLKLTGTEQTRHAMVRDLQVDPLTNEISHLDFQRIAMDQKLRVHVRIELVGTPEGVKTDGGLLDFVTRELEIECMPSAIPSEIKVDVSELRVEQHLEARELTLPDGVEYVGSPDAVVVSIKHARVEEVAPAAEGVVAAAAEPEVIQRGKKDEATES
ncbi:MAG: 50S ribosomal protein L25 [Thermoanaerobaculia bacterium]|nr:50S ribosomal protein L25 [Thermoanaerobaculia bacterium]